MATTQEHIDYLKSIGVDTTPSEDKDMSFKPLKGGYEVEIKKVERREGNKDGKNYDFWAVKMQVVNTLEGDKGNNRYIDKTYNNIGYEDPNGKFKTEDIDGARNLIRDLQVTSGISLQFGAGDTVHDIIEKNKDAVVGRRMFVRAYEKKGRQVCVVVNELKIKNPFVDKKEDELPF